MIGAGYTRNTKRRNRHVRYDLGVGKYQLYKYEMRIFASTGHALAEQRFGSYEDVKKWFAAKGEDFYWRGKLSER